MLMMMLTIYAVNLIFTNILYSQKSEYQNSNLAHRLALQGLCKKLTL